LLAARFFCWLSGRSVAPSGVWISGKKFYGRQMVFANQND